MAADSMTTSQASQGAAVDPGMLDKLAEAAVRVGLKLRPGQDVVMTAPVAALPLVRRIAEHAYRAGAGLVVPFLTDEEVSLARFRDGQGDGFDRAPGWLYEGMAKAFDEGAARLAIVGDDPMLLSEMDPEKVGRANKATAVAMKPTRDRITRFETNWTIVAYPTASWARRVFPDLPEEEGVARLARAIFAASRLEGDDPAAEWERHNAELRRRCDWLNGHRFDALHYTGPGTDLTIGLPEGHRWLGGEERVARGGMCNPNIPTEEVFTTPHAGRTEGTVRSTKPLSHNGTLIENIRVRFEGGRIVEAHADKGEEVLRKVLETDEGAARLGEVALVPHSSPISQSGLLFYNTLFDENAASHVALGQCYSVCFEGELTPEEVEARGGNRSAIHIDWMIGSGEIDIDGVKADGSRVPVMRAGEWAE
jgi:aminopeptidase